MGEQESILISIKKLLGIDAFYEAFDTDVIIHINTVFAILTQLGYGPPEGFSIKDKSACWTDFILEENRIEAVKTYMYMKVKLIFDPPSSAAVIEAYKQNIAEFEWRINVAAESAKS